MSENYPIEGIAQLLLGGFQTLGSVYGMGPS